MTIVSTALGQLRGEQNGTLRVFRGVPYAQPLRGLGRIRRPQAVAPWPGVREALEFGSAAPQPAIPNLDAGPIGDDCLTLNIWAPQAAQPLPVMVWIHGGGFFAGSSAQSLYDGARLAQDNQVVVVSLNYRLGILGFGCWDELPQLEGDSNNGLRDQILALQWVRQHIADFGGDPGRVTVFGESAGAISIACLLASPPARGLFHRAIAQSGSGDLVMPRAEALKPTRAFAAAAGDVKACLEGGLAGIVAALRFNPEHSVERGARAQPVPLHGLMPFPLFGDEVLPEPPHAALAAGRGGGVPLIVGTNRHEWNLFHYLPQILGLPPALLADDTALAPAFDKNLPGRGAAMLEAYRGLLPGLPANDLFCAFESDRFFIVPAIRLLEAAAAAGTPAWSYVFDWPCPMLPNLGSCHAMDLPFTFGTTGAGLGQFFTGGGKAAAKLSAQMRAAWAAFAHGQAPAAPDLPEWPAHTLPRRAALRLAAAPGIVDDPEGARRALWDGQL